MWLTTVSAFRLRVSKLGLNMTKKIMVKKEHCRLQDWCLQFIDICKVFKIRWNNSRQKVSIKPTVTNRKVLISNMSRNRYLYVEEERIEDSFFTYRTSRVWTSPNVIGIEPLNLFPSKNLRLKNDKQLDDGKYRTKTCTYHGLTSLSVSSQSWKVWAEWNLKAGSRSNGCAFIKPV